MSRFTFSLEETDEAAKLPLSLTVSHTEQYSNECDETFPSVLQIEGTNPNGYTWTSILRIIIAELERMYGYKFDIDKLKEEE